MYRLKSFCNELYNFINGMESYTICSSTTKRDNTSEIEGPKSPEGKSEMNAFASQKRKLTHPNPLC